MKVIEFVEYMKKNTNRTMKEDQFMAVAKKVLDVKNYLSMRAKKDLVDKIIGDCLYYENGIYKFDGIQKYICFTMYVIDAYTNIELNQNIEADLDMLSESNLLSIVIGAVGKEYDDVNILLQLKCDDILMDNSIEVQCGKLFSYVIDSIDNLQNNIGGLADILQKEDILQLLKSFKH